MGCLINCVTLAVCSASGSAVLNSSTTPVVLYDNDVPHEAENN